MNDIGTSLLPVTRVAATESAPNALANAAQGAGKNFDSLLQQRTDATPDAAVANPEVGPSLPIERPAKMDDATDAPNAAAQAGFIAMIPPPILPLPVPISTSLANEAVANPVVGDATRELVAPSPEPTAPAFPRTAAANTPALISPPLQQTPPVSAPVTDANASQTVTAFNAFPKSEPPVAEPLPQTLNEAATPQHDAKHLPRNVEAPTLDVASVLGIIPPVQTAPAVSVESVLQNKPAVSTAAGGDRVVTITQPIPLGRSQSVLSTAGNEPAIVAASAPAVAPATFAAPVAEPIRTEVGTTTQTPQILSESASTPVSVPISAISDPAKFTGMIAAKPGRGMPAATLQRVTQIAPETSAGPVSNAALADASPIDGMLRTAPVAAVQNGREHSGNDQSNNTEPPPTPQFSPTHFSSETPLPLSANDASAPIRATDVAQVVTHTLRATEQLRVSGQERVELAVKLDGGHQLTIHLHMANGEVTPIIRTDSEPLRAALELNWSQFAQRGGDSDLRITTPVFESPKTSSNMSDLNQQRDGRQRAFNEPAQESFQSLIPRRATPPSPPHPALTTPAQTPGVRLYA